MTSRERPHVFHTDRFEREMRKLDGPSREKVERTIRTLQEDPKRPGLHVESVQRASKNVRSCRVTRRVRLIFRVTPDGLELLHVGDHDEAYRAAVVYWMSYSFEADHTFDGEEPEMIDMPFFHAGQLRESMGAELQELDLGDDVSAAVLRIVEAMLAGGTEGKASALPGRAHGAGLGINCIPGDSPVPCGPVLLAFCFDRDNFDQRLREVAYHAGILCPDTRLVVLITTKWDPAKWKKNHADAFANLGARTLVLFHGLGSTTRIA